MNKALIGYAVLIAALVVIGVYARPAAANIPVFPANHAGIEHAEPTCYGWFTSWREDKTVLRTNLKQAIKNATRETGGWTERESLCMLMNVDYIINTILDGCNGGVPLDVAFMEVVQATGYRCSQ